tara:strand:+ start:1545 stop:2039 length:495 start_codon:yes stop_codon:yes gene_type:complete
MIETIKFNDKEYPLFQALGNASQFALPYAKLLCKGRGYDIGYGKEAWKLEGAIGIDVNDGSPFDAYRLPEEKVDYIYSSHCLEHLPDWVKALSYWVSKLRKGGDLVLYLPHKDQEYWLPWNNRKHIHILTAESVIMCLKSLGMTDLFSSERDLNHSFLIVGNKK